MGVISVQCLQLSGAPSLDYMITWEIGKKDWHSLVHAGKMNPLGPMLMLCEEAKLHGGGLVKETDNQTNINYLTINKSSEAI